MLTHNVGHSTNYYLMSASVTLQQKECYDERAQDAMELQGRTQGKGVNAWVTQSSEKFCLSCG